MPLDGVDEQPIEADPLGRAMLDYRRGGLRGVCEYVDGAERTDAQVADHYFAPPTEWPERWQLLLDSLDGPVLDVGCGAGQYALFLQDDREVVAVDASPGAVEAAREGGVVDARVMDMFALDFPRDRFRSALVNGTQLGLAGSFAGIRAFLSDLAGVTDESGVAVVDSYDPTRLDAESFFGYRSDPRRGVARRAFHVEYRDSESGESSGAMREVGRALSFLLFSPNRLADALVGTPWHVVGVRRRDGDPYYRAVLEKRR
ncbi:class I SAM-dependent methyltransferase [Haloprofundus halophilus]|uniref:class I SAM-dependent methyltransferase n=1 Tax=Haloprofundus halophilus TaxID=2283527 RepID=UPI000E442A38|nr:class I SAM-dependent methyltransferase [Haloprofundus halophilus]